MLKYIQSDQNYYKFHGDKAVVQRLMKNKKTRQDISYMRLDHYLNNNHHCIVSSHLMIEKGKNIPLCKMYMKIVHPY
jgi:ribosomal protein L18E